MRQRMLDAIKGSKADYTEIRVEEREDTTIAFRGKELDVASGVIDTGGVVRCLCRDGGWGVATFNDLDDLGSRVEQAYLCAKVAESEEPIELAAIPVAEDLITVPMIRDFRSVTMGEKLAQAESYNNILLDHSDKIIDTNTVYMDTFSRACLATSEGTYIEEERPMVTAYGTATARDGDNVQRAFESRSGQFGFEYVVGLEEMYVKAAQRAVDLLSADTVVGGTYPVVLNPLLAGVFIHEAFGHLSESDFVYENPKAQEMMVLGRRFGQDILNVFDDGSVPGARGTHKYDDEGTPTGRTDLIKDGILVGRLHSRETAAKMGEKPTGNARATGYRYPPIVRMTNTAIEGGETPLEDMIGDITLGIYAANMFGGQTALENFSFSSAYAYMIRDGEIAEMVKDVILAGNLFTTLQKIDAVGKDFHWCDAAGRCGKGQGGLYTAEGAPHIRIQDVIVGGK